MARPEAKIDLAELEKLAGMQCTEEEIAAFFGVSRRTIVRRCQMTKFREVMEQGRAKGRVSVRRSLFKLANAGNIAAAIFLAKNILGYRDVVNNEHSGPGGSPIEVASKPDLSQLTDDELRQLRDIAAKTIPARRN
ncbi:MAG TPA: hypothetical protein VIY49_23335 [Bryobacteraceae bacterium]